MTNPVVQVILDMVYLGLEKFGRYYSEYRGFVSNNEDPDGYGRLQIVVPGIIDNPTENWVYGTGQFSGKGYGCQVLPKKGDVIFVTFENGDPNFPLWKLGHFGDGDIPKELRDPQIYWFKTPEGILAELDDTKKEMRITDSFGNKIVMSKEGISMKTDKQIFLGDLKSGEDSVSLGNLTSDLMAKQNEGIIKAYDYIDTVAKSFTDLSTKMAAAGTPAGLIISLATNVPDIVTKVNSSITSGKASNESIKAITNKIPEIKSKKVKVHE